MATGYENFLLGVFAAHEDTVRLLIAETSAPEVLRWLASDLRLGSGGRWEGMAAPLEGRRALLLAEVAEAMQRLGCSVIESDFLPGAPDFVPSTNEVI